jgi:hypothetical protein
MKTVLKGGANGNRFPSKSSDNDSFVKIPFFVKIDSGIFGDFGLISYPQKTLQGVAGLFILLFLRFSVNFHWKYRSVLL